MAKFVLAGRADCSWYARAEMLADTLKARLPDFRVNKVVVSAEEWPQWVAETCQTNGWTHSGESSPMLWRELVDTGGKGLYLGGLKEFEEYALKYYAISPSTDTVLEDKIASENFQTFLQQQQERENFVPTPPVKICVTDATSTVSYHLIQLLASGAVTGPDTMLALHLFNPELNSICEGLIMELQDLASPCLEYIKFSTSMEEAFAGTSLVYILDCPYTKHNLNLFTLDTRNTHLTTAANQFRDYVKALECVASTDVKVVLSGCFANTGAGLMAASASSLPASSFVASPCLAESQMKAVLASRLHLNGSDILQAAVWGKTHGPAIITDTTFTRVQHFPGAVMGPDPFDLPLKRCEFDTDWREKTFSKLMAARHGELQGYGEEGAAISEAVGLAHFGRDWWLGETRQWRSVGVVSDGTAYGIPKGVCCSTPCHCKEGKWETVPDLALTETIQEQLATQVDLLKAELDLSLMILEGATTNLESPTTAQEPQ